MLEILNIGPANASSNICIKDKFSQKPQRNLNALSQPRHRVYNTCRSWTYSVLLKVPQFVPSVHWPTEQFGISFTNDTTETCNVWPDNVHSTTSLVYKGQNWGFMSHSTARVILGQVLSIVTCCGTGTTQR